ncbi:MAG: Zn-dependent exopeptidase M28 [Clostridiales bacterium]|nr:Zn-dependent exopeptidase M28 [Clostridiales bacterium]
MKYLKTLSILAVLFLLIGCQSIGNNNVTNDNAVSTEETVDNVENEPISDGQTDDVSIKEEEDILTFNYLDETQTDSSRAIELIRELTSKKYDGRQAGTAANELAEDYMVNMFKEIGLESPEGLDYKQLYTQKAAYPVKATEISIVGSDLELEYQVDFTERFLMGQTYYDAEIESEMVYIMDRKQLIEEVSLLDGKVLLMTKEVYYDYKTWGRIDKLLATGIEIEALVVSSEASASGMRVSRYVKASEGLKFEEDDPVLIILSEDSFSKITKLSEEDAIIKISMDYEVIDAEVANIVGIIPGKNEIGEDETLIIGAHLDHLGNNMNGTYNAGALDNASGISVITELARAFMAGEQPEDTIVFVAFNGEEDGLLGSQYFSENPPIEYDPNHTKMLNLDMVGSSGEVPLMICTFDYTGKKMKEDLASLASLMDLDYITEFSGGSDHVNFSNQGVASVMLIQFDDAYYHTYMDTVENAISEKRLNDIILLSLAFVDQEVFE